MLRLSVHDFTISLPKRLHKFQKPFQGPYNAFVITNMSVLLDLFCVFLTLSSSVWHWWCSFFLHVNFFILFIRSTPGTPEWIYCALTVVAIKHWLSMAAVKFGGRSFVLFVDNGSMCVCCHCFTSEPRIYFSWLHAWLALSSMTRRCHSSCSA